MIHHKNPVITIDGASGTGKGTVSQLLARQLGWKFLDSGALYRVLALAAQRHGFSFDNEKLLDEEGLQKLAEHLNVHFIAQQDQIPHIILEGEDVTEKIRIEEIGNAASIVASLSAVRSALLSRQRAFREAPGLVADGRDMGTVVFPDAEFKFFLIASPEERALRRYKQLKAKGDDVILADLVGRLKERDKRDQERLVAPLKPAQDAICINTDDLTVEQVIEKILLEINQKKAFPAVMYQAMNLAEAGAAE
jgi:cytidylate kinase